VKDCEPIAAEVIMLLLGAPGPAPAELTAYTVNVYNVLGVSPVTLIDVPPVVVDPPDQVIL
jgi:hypothetical protein